MTSTKMFFTRLRSLVPMLLCGAFLLLSAGCDDEKQIGYGKLPAAAQAFIEHYFPECQVVSAEREKDDGGKEYQVTLCNGTQIEFDARGDWTSVDCKFSLLPEGIIPEPIRADLATRYPEAAVHKIERQLGGYELSLSNAKQLIYAADGTFVREEIDL